MAIARNSGRIGDYRVTAASEAVEKSRLADVRPADDDHDGAHDSLLNADREHSAFAGLHQHRARIEGDGRGTDRAAVGRNACSERAILSRDEMDVAFEITDDDEATERERPAHTPPCKLVLFPQAAAVRFIECD